MPLTNELIKQAYETFLDREPSQSEINEITLKNFDENDLLYFLLAKTSFLKDYHSIKEVFDSLGSPVSRSFLSEENSSHIKNKVVKELKSKLHEKQVDWAIQSSRMLALEEDICVIKNKIIALV